MGDASHPVNLWHWKAWRLRDSAGVLDLVVDGAPHGTRVEGGRPDVPVYMKAPGVSRESAEADSESRPPSWPSACSSRWAAPRPSPPRA